MSRTTFVAAAGLLLAVVAEACSVGLVGLAGWFIAGSAVAGASAYCLFSYTDPSGGVRAFAVGRIATSYANRVVLHAAALRRVSAARLGFYDRAAAQPASYTAWSGQSLDRVMADADTHGMALIQATAPMMVAAAMTAAGCLVIAVSGYPWAAAIVAIGAAVCAALAVASARRVDDGSRIRGELRAELVTAVDAWPEMASLGAARHLAERARRQLDIFERRLTERAQTRARVVGAARALTSVALPLALVSVASSGAHVSMLVFVALLTVGVMGNAERLVAAAEARRLAEQAHERLASAADAAASRRPLAPALRARYDGRSLTIRGDARLEVEAGRTLIVTGASGRGKTTLLNAIAAALRDQGTHVTAVDADDYIFTGTVATNIRLADPAASDAEISELLTDVLLLDLEPGTPVGVGGRSLSGGEQRRLQIARALAAKADVLLIDEPTTGLDANTANHVLGAVRERLPRAVLILAMHEPPADRTVLGLAPSTLPLE